MKIQGAALGVSRACLELAARSRPIRHCLINHQPLIVQHPFVRQLRVVRIDPRPNFVLQESHVFDCVSDFTRDILNTAW